MTTCPPSVISLDASTAQRHGALALIFIVQSQCFSWRSAAGCWTPEAALLISMSSLPNSSWIWEKSSAILAPSPRWALTRRHRTPSDSISAWASLADLWSLR